MAILTPLRTLALRLQRLFCTRLNRQLPSGQSVTILIWCSCMAVAVLLAVVADPQIVLFWLSHKAQLIVISSLPSKVRLSLPATAIQRWLVVTLSPLPEQRFCSPHLLSKKSTPTLRKSMPNLLTISMRLLASTTCNCSIRKTLRSGSLS